MSPPGAYTDDMGDLPHMSDREIDQQLVERSRRPEHQVGEPTARDRQKARAGERRFALEPRLHEYD